ncbi:hypothetical protein CRE_18239 [Caenorhabditis remanei]|uniref:Protein kinase domain-containing protein n=1 Tax=Caenorhabditis remanei TaxID=31234 RepID=E3NFI9_CAERE|nr:hypothetical protein CRE_18239 [Caenorhabditis remanei]
MPSRRSPTSPIPTDSPSTPTPTSLSPSGNSSNSSETFPTPLAPSPEFIQDTTTTEDESEAEENVNLGIFEFRGASCREKSQFLTLQKCLFSDRVRKSLGEGTFGKNRKLFAAKFFLVKEGDDVFDYASAIGPEQRVYEYLGSSVHQNIAKIVGIDFVNWAPDNCYRKIILMPLLGISIGQMIDQAQKLDLENRNLIGVDASKAKVSFRIKHIQEMGSNVLNGLQFLLEHHVLHLDLKSENVLFSSKNSFHVDYNGTSHSFIAPRDTHVKIADFGLSRVESDIGDTADIFQTETYRSPEIYSGCLPNKKSDVWSFSILLLEMYTGADDFLSSETENAEVQRFRNLQYAIDQRMTRDLWDEAAKTKGGNETRGALKLYDDGAPDSTAPRLMSLKRSYHADQLFEFLKYSLILDWHSRPSVDELLSHNFFKNI